MCVRFVFAPNPIQERDPRLARQFEQVVTEAVQTRDLDEGPLQVRFHVWDGDDLPRYVCKVECPSARAVEMEELPWRWWSGLVETPQELGQELREAVRQQGRRRTATGDERPAPRPLERWGGAGELQLR